jgi:hypothetical protein
MAHFSGPRMAQVVRAIGGHEHFGEAMELALLNGISERRREMRARRIRTDNQYFHRFGIQW